MDVHGYFGRRHLPFSTPTSCSRATFCLWFAASDARAHGKVPSRRRRTVNDAASRSRLNPKINRWDGTHDISHLWCLSLNHSDILHRNQTNMTKKHIISLKLKCTSNAHTVYVMLCYVHYMLYQCTFIMSHDIDSLVFVFTVVCSNKIAEAAGGRWPAPRRSTAWNKQVTSLLSCTTLLPCDHVAWQMCWVYV